MKLSYALKGMWVIKYRPENLSGMVLPNATKEQLEVWKKDGEFPNLLLCSRAGMGKTSLAKVIATEFECDYIYINASDEGNVETIRTKVKDFAITASFNGRMKLVILDEADGFANIQSQKILRALMEEVADTCRFILTANYRHKIIEPIISRCVELDMTPPKPGIIRRCIEILKLEGFHLHREELEKLRGLVDAFYPDIRSVIKTLQNCIDENSQLKIKEFKVENVFIDNLIEMIVNNKDAVAARRYVIENELKFGCDYNNLLMQIYKFVIDNEQLTNKLRAEWTIVIAEYLYRMTSAIDLEICMSACIAEMVTKLG